MVGQWVHMDLESVQITRITLTDSRRQEQIGSDHYFQIDAVGDLGGVVIKIENADKSIPPATFQGRYPVSIVTKELPDFLRSQIRNQSGGGAVVASVRQKFGMDGFFYRLWGYESDFMAQQGGGQQFGPLLIVSEIPKPGTRIGRSGWRWNDWNRRGNRGIDRHGDDLVVAAEGVGSR